MFLIKRSLLSLVNKYQQHSNWGPGTFCTGAIVWSEITWNTFFWFWKVTPIHSAVGAKHVRDQRRWKVLTADFLEGPIYRDTAGKNMPTKHIICWNIKKVGVGYENPPRVQLKAFSCSESESSNTQQTDYTDVHFWKVRILIIPSFWKPACRIHACKGLQIVQGNCALWRPIHRFQKIIILNFFFHQSSDVSLYVWSNFKYHLCIKKKMCNS